MKRVAPLKAMDGWPRGTAEEMQTLTARQLARRKRIVAAAMDLAARGGYEAVQMRAVAARARVALGTLYRYFSSKDQLLGFTWADWSHELEIQLTRHPLNGAGHAGRIMDFVRRATRALENEPRLARALIRSLLSPDRNAIESRKEMGAVMARIVDAELKELEPTDREGIGGILGQVWYANLVLWINGQISVERLYEHMATACRLLLAHRETAPGQTEQGSAR